ncbi:hypothetical protein G5V58_06215 [Nocardioides anomalus]|uniref:receptor protein-tyrosine kinase n=1 Tax=Nocardioides anomalus TaxID=2712223 RepID=A0A6G6WB31_9ACTN|nr:glycine-rich protein [Nocardioides anomalus]QIG42419.1 hypothetical protein G5V58_06215 [Nocardioides anomalus]
MSALRRTAAAAVAALVVAGLTTVDAPARAAEPQTVRFSYTGAEQQWVVPAGVTAVQVVATGAAGGGPGGGLGATAAATVPVTPGAVLYVEVGGAGTSVAGGFNGGGSSSAPSGGQRGAGGGGASDVRTVPRLQGGASLPSRLVVAAGGGGAGGGSAFNGGAGGAGNVDGGGAGASGAPGINGAVPGGGASQVTGGPGGGSGGSGQLGTGGAGGPGGDAGGGGGGGLYGGGGGAGGAPAAGGGGGSSGFAVGASRLLVTGATGPASVSITWTPPTTVPETTLGKAPGRKVTTHQRKAKVKVSFGSPNPGATYECSLDAKPFAPCASPAKLRVKKGRHTFAVRAVLAGVSDPTPATVRFEVRRKKRH